MPVTLRQFLWSCGILAVLGVVGGALWVWSGLYNVSASREHLDPTTQILDLVRRQSVETWSSGTKAPPLDDPGLVRLGAAHFELACAPCHGAPGRAPSALQAVMLPQPPDLGGTVTDWTSEELHWIVLNGQKYTGMPSWPSIDREEEVWPVVAFLQELPGMDAAAYADLAGLSGGSPSPGDITGFSIDGAGSGGRLAVCARCHGDDGASPAGDLVPDLTGQTQGYLARALREYRDGTRASGIMQVAAATLTDEEIAQLSAHFARPAPAPASPAPRDADPAALARGRVLAEEGRADRTVPACLACHDAAARADFPRLAGLSARYIEQQLHVLKANTRGRSAFAAIMTPIASRLEGDEIRDVAAYLESLPADYRRPMAEAAR
jgi:cytochrome c553